MQPTPERPGARSGATAVAAVLGVLLLVVLGAWAASVGPSGLFRGDGIEPEHGITLPAKSDPTATDSAEPAADKPPGAGMDWTWVRVVAIIVELALLALVLFLLYRGGRWAVARWQDRRRPEPDPVEVDFDVIDADALVEELVRDSARQRALLEQGSPRNGIVRCWHEFEVSAARAGFARKPWQTPAEYTLLILDLVEAEQGAVARLADRYREARFSEHEVSEADRRDALEALDQIHAELGVRVGARR